METNNKVHREVGLQKNLKLVVTKINSQFSGEADIQTALSVINKVAGNDQNIGFLRSITGVGTILGNVMIIDLDVPLMNYRPITSSVEAAFNGNVAQALVKAFGRVNVGYVSPKPSRTINLTVHTSEDVETITNALKGVSDAVEVR